MSNRERNRLVRAIAESIFRITRNHAALEKLRALQERRPTNARLKKIRLLMCALPAWRDQLDADQDALAVLDGCSQESRAVERLRRRAEFKNWLDLNEQQSEQSNAD